MMRLRHKLLIHAFRLSDQVSLWLALVLSIATFGGKSGHNFLRDFTEDYHPMSDFVGVGLLALVWAAVFAVIVRYEANRFTSLRASLLGIVKATALCSFILLTVAEVFDVEMVSQTVVVGHWAGAALLIGTGRLVIRLLLSVLRKSGYNRRNVVLVGINERSIRLASSMEDHPELGYRIGGFVTESDAADHSGDLLGGKWEVVSRLEDFRAYLEKGIVDEVMVCLPVREKFGTILDLLGIGQEQGIVIRVVPDLGNIEIIERAQVEAFGGEKMLTFFRENLLWQLLAKRVLDFTVSVVVLLLLSPLLLAVALAIKLTDGGPVFFSQERVGMNKRKFRIHKFRSMVVDAEARKAALASQNEMEGPAFKMKNDPRITRVGRFIRKTSLDEFPQLWNVIKGEMSLVGPRPPLPTEVDQYEWLQRRRLSIKPGITCLWQVGGRSNLSFEKWMELDRVYCENWSFWLDLKILLKTIPVVLLGKGAA